MRKWLCIVAHPDDETLMAGGTLAMLAECKVAVHILCATRGEGGTVGDPPVCAKEELGRVREAELCCAASALGACSVEFLDYVDPDSTPEDGLRPLTDDPVGLEARIHEVLCRLRPDCLLTHGSSGEYGHPAHVQVHQAVVRAHQAVLAQSDFAPALYAFCAAIPGVPDRFWNTADKSDVVLDVTSWLDKKMAAAECHRSQYTAFFDGRPPACTLREALRESEGLHCVWSPDGRQPPELAEWEYPDVLD